MRVGLSMLGFATALGLGRAGFGVAVRWNGHVVNMVA